MNVSRRSHADDWNRGCRRPDEWHNGLNQGNDGLGFYRRNRNIRVIFFPPMLHRQRKSLGYCDFFEYPSDFFSANASPAKSKCFLILADSTLRRLVPERFLVVSILSLERDVY